MMHNKHSKATALITAILIVAVVSITAITMQGYLRTEMNRTQLMLDSDSLLNNLYDIETWGLAKLKRMATTSEIWNAEKANTKINDYNKVSEGKIVPLRGLFNINYLYSESYCAGKQNSKDPQVIDKIFENLLKNTNVLADSDNDTKNIIQDIKTWMCPNKKDYSADFNNDDPDWAYQIARQPIIDISEVNMATSLSRKAFINLTHYITAFPVMTANSKVQISFDVDSMSQALLSGIANINLDTAKEFLENIKAKPTAEKSEAILKYITEQNIYSPEELAELKKYFTPASGKSSSYYMIYGTASLRNNIMQMQTLVYLDKNPEILWRKRGKHYA